ISSSLMHIIFSLFFFLHLSTTEIYTLSLHDALPIYHDQLGDTVTIGLSDFSAYITDETIACYIESVTLYYDCALTRQGIMLQIRSEEHTSELQSRFDLVCRLLLEKKK